MRSVTCVVWLLGCGWFCLHKALCYIVAVLSLCCNWACSFFFVTEPLSTGQAIFGSQNTLLRRRSVFVLHPDRGGLARLSLGRLLFKGIVPGVSAVSAVSAVLWLLMLCVVVLYGCTTAKV